MKLHKVILTLLFVSQSLVMIAQNSVGYKLYLDENNEPIEIEDYYKKCNAFLYTCRKIQKDSVLINDMFDSYRFDKLTKSENTQIRHLLTRMSNIKGLNHKTILLSFSDILYSYDYHLRSHEEFQEKITLPDSLSEIAKTNIYKERNKHSQSKFNQARKLHDKKQKSCIKMLHKKEVQPIYLYSNILGYSYQPKHFKWKKASKAIKTIFFKSGSGIVILKPDGEYFYYKYLPEEILKKMLKDNDWSEYITDYSAAKNSLLKNRNGFFADFKKYNPTPKRFYIQNRNKYSQRSNQLTTGTIIVRNRAMIQSYLQTSTKCYSYGSY